MSYSNITKEELEVKLKQQRAEREAAEKCPTCGADLRLNADRCPSCFTRLEKGAQVCPKCGCNVREYIAGEENARLRATHWLHERGLKV